MLLLCFKSKCNTLVCGLKPPPAKQDSVNKEERRRAKKKRQRLHPDTLPLRQRYKKGNFCLKKVVEPYICLLAFRAMSGLEEENYDLQTSIYSCSSLSQTYMNFITLDMGIQTKCQLKTNETRAFIKKSASLLLTSFSKQLLSRCLFTKCLKSVPLITAIHKVSQS